MNRIDTSSDPIISIKGNKLVDCNEAALCLFGYLYHKEAFLQLSLQDLLSDHQPSGVFASKGLLQLLEQVSEEGIGKAYVICKNKAGEEFPVDLQMISLCQECDGTMILSKWKSSNIKRGACIFPKVNDKKEHDGDCSFILQVNYGGQIVFASSSVCKLLNFSESEILDGIHIGDITELPVLSTEASVNQSEGVIDFYNLGLEAPEEIVFLSKDHKRIPARVNFRRLKIDHNEPEVFQLHIQPAEEEITSLGSPENPALEITGLKRENKSLRRVHKILKKSLDRLRVLAEYSPDVIMQFNRAHRHLFVNSQVFNFTGIPPEDFLGKTCAEVGFPKEFCSTCEEILNEVFTSGKSKRTELLLPGGIWVDWFLMPEFNHRQEVNTVIATAKDITLQKKTQLKLQKSERKLNDAFEVTKLSSWSYDFRKDEIKTNSNFNSLIGLQIAMKDNRFPASVFLREFVLPEDHGKIKFLINAALASCSEDFQEIIDFRIGMPNGEIVHILASVRLELGKDGRVEKAYGTIQDITQLRLTEQELEEYRTSLERLVETRTQELKKSEEKLADALRLANLGTWEYDPFVDGFLVSEEVLEIIGTTSEIEGGNAVGVQRIKEVIHPDDYPVYRQAVLCAQDRTDEEYTGNAEIRISRSDGDIRYIYLSIKISRMRGQVKYFGTVQDITEIRHAEFEKERLNAIIEATSDIVGIVQPSGNLIYLNKAGKTFFGIKEEEDLLLKTFFNFQSLKSSKALAEEVLKEVDRSGLWSGESEYVRHDGVEIPVSQVIVAHKNSQEQVECYSTIIRDISQQKKIEQDLIFKNNELDTFVYRASHDLRGPIATLMGLYNLVQYEIKDDQALSLFDMYNSQILRMNTIILTLIELTKIKEREFQPSVVNFKKTVKNVFNKLQAMTESKDMLFEQDIEPVEGYVSDEHLLSVILQNMVENSIKYKRQNTDSFVRVEVKKVKDTDRILIKVSDNGIGIDSAIQNKIYNMFFRGNERSSGSGLGLYILKNAVEKLGGKVALYSVVYKGTTFKIELPPLRVNKQESK